MKQLVKRRDPVTCLICKTRVSRRDNLKRHLMLRHEDFLSFRAHHFQTDNKKALKDTLNNHIFENKLPEILQSRCDKGLITHFLSQKDEDSCTDEAQTVARNRKLEDTNKELALEHDKDVENRPTESEPVKTVDSAKEKDLFLQSESYFDGHDDSLVKEHKPEGDIQPCDKEDSLVSKRNSKPDGKSIDPNTCSPSKTVMTDSSLGKAADKSNKDFQRQIELVKICQCCELLKTFAEMTRDHVAGIISRLCKCTVKENCCCRKMEKVMFSRSTETESQLNKEKTMLVDFEKEFFSLEAKSGETRYFCHKCYKYSNRIKLTKNGNNWTTVGFKVAARYRLRELMKIHLKSLQHKQACDLENKEGTIDSKRKVSLMKAQLSIKCTENLMLCAQFLASHYQSYRYFEEFCLIQDIMASNLSDSKECLSLLGNKQHGKMALRQAQIACYNAVTENMYYKNSLVQRITKYKKRHMISVDKGTANRDATRQVIVSTHISNEGHPTEVLISAACCYDATATGAADHVKKECSKIMDTKTVCVICTDGASVYTGSENGMIAQLKRDVDFSDKLVYLPDLCHKAERLVFHKKTGWVYDVLETSSFIVSGIRQHSYFGKALKTAQQNSGKIYFSMQTMCKTRFVEYSHNHINSILKNLPILVCNEGLPSIINSDDCDELTKQLARQILINLAHPVFIARLILLDRVFVEIAEAEKKAQGKDFGPFEFLVVVQKLERTLEAKLKSSLGEDLEFFLSTRILNFTFSYRGKLRKEQIDFSLVQLSLGNFRPIKKYNLDMQEVRDSYLEWVSGIVSDFSNYLEIPWLIDLVSKIFCEEYDPQHKIQYFKELMNSINIEFYSCGHACKGLDKCLCFDYEVERFSSHFASLIYKKHSSTKVGLGHCKEILAYYLVDSNAEEIESLNIVNVARCIEIVLLLKSSQSSTERVMSVISKVVKGRYENIYLSYSDKKVDMVNTSVFIAENGVLTLDQSKQAFKKFKESGHSESLQKCHAVGRKSSTVKRKYKLLDSGSSWGMKRAHKTPRMEVIDLLPIEHSDRGQGDISLLDDDPDDPGIQEDNVDNISGVVLKPETPVVDDRVDIKAKNLRTASRDTNESKAVKMEIKSKSKPKTPKTIAKRKYIWCICRTEDEYGDFIGCANVKSCVSYINRLKTLNSLGGDWFHYTCLGITADSIKGDWFCKECEKASVQSSLPLTAALAFKKLERDLLEENKKLVKIRGDGNCMFAAMSVACYGTPEFHADIRLELSKNLENIFKSNKYENQWSYQTCPKENLSSDLEAKFVHDIVALYRNQIEDTYDANEEIPMHKRQLYLDRLRYPAKERDSLMQKKDKYGTEIEMALFSLIKKKVIWNLEKITVKGKPSAFRWRLLVNYVNPGKSHEEQLEASYYMVYYQFHENTVYCHYDVIVHSDSATETVPPKCRVYNYGSEDLSKICCKECEGIVIPTIRI